MLGKIGTSNRFHILFRCIFDGLRSRSRINRTTLIFKSSQWGDTLGGSNKIRTSIGYLIINCLFLIENCICGGICMLMSDDIRSKGPCSQ